MDLFLIFQPRGFGAQKNPILEVVWVYDCISVLLFYALIVSMSQAFEAGHFNEEFLILAAFQAATL